MKLFWFDKRVNLTSDCSQLMAEVVSNIPAQRMHYFLYWLGSAWFAASYKPCFSHTWFVC